jgi:carbon monoxide dehydrogenase subunit G
MGATMPRVRREVTIRAPREHVWAILSDLGSVSEWSPNITHSVCADGEGLGAVRHCELPGAFGSIDETVTDWVDGQRFEVDIAGARMMRSMHTSMAVEGALSGGSRVVMTTDFTMKFGPLGTLMAAMMGKRLTAKAMGETLGGLKQFAEASPVAEGGGNAPTS